MGLSRQRQSVCIGEIEEERECVCAVASVCCVCLGSETLNVAFQVKRSSSETTLNVFKTLRFENFQEF